jgi:hypothetical protein
MRAAALRPLSRPAAAACTASSRRLRAAGRPTRPPVPRPGGRQAGPPARRAGGSGGGGGSTPARGRARAVRAVALLDYVASASDDGVLRLPARSELDPDEIRSVFGYARWVWGPARAIQQLPRPALAHARHCRMVRGSKTTATRRCGPAPRMGPAEPRPCSMRRHAASRTCCGSRPRREPQRRPPRTSSPEVCAGAAPAHVRTPITPAAR